jgi:hypothetical protein
MSKQQLFVMGRWSDWNDLKVHPWSNCHINCSISKDYYTAIKKYEEDVCHGGPGKMLLIN